MGCTKKVLDICKVSSYTTPMSNTPLFNYEQLHNASGKRLTKSLFIETCQSGRWSQALFTLGRYDRPHWKTPVVSLWKLYMQFAVDDPTEYTFAERVFGDYAFWENVRKRVPIKDLIDEWEAEAELKRKSKLVNNLVDATSDEKQGFQASKFLLQQGGLLRPSKSGMDGRKARSENKKEVEEAVTAREFEDDLDRINAAFSNPTIQ